MKIYIIGIGGIGTSGLARYYLSQGYEVYGSDAQNSEITEKLTQEGVRITIGVDPDIIDTSFEKVVYSSAINETQGELQKARELSIPTYTYPQDLGNITHNYKLISVAGTHGKSTTTSLVSLVLKDTSISFSSIVGSQLREFGGKNYFHQQGQENENKYFVLESCEYKKNFLNYHPFIVIITNIEADHLDYYKNEKNYIQAFEEFINNVQVGGCVIVDKYDTNSQKLIGKRKDISYIIVDKNSYVVDNQVYQFPDISMQVPGDHIFYDAKLAYIVGKILEIDEQKIVSSLQNYNGIWRRMEKIGLTENGNTLMSDYGHHPTEILLTTQALKDRYPDKKLFVVFQPHQYSRTIELMEGFKDCFIYCDTLIVPNIYESRDSEDDKKRMSGEIFVNALDHNNKYFGDGFENTLKLIEEYDRENPYSSIILLLGAGNIDDLRYKIKTS